MADQLASEVEQLVAQARAGWNGDDGGIDRVLGDLDPSLLYAAAVNALLERLLTSEAMMTAYSGLADTLTHEKAWLRQQGLWLSNLPTMAALLSPVRQRQVPASG